MAVEVLIIRLSAIGDVVHALPVVASLKRQIKDVRITWVVEPMAAPLLVDNPAVDEVLIFPGKAIVRALNPFLGETKKLHEAVQFFKSLRARRFDLVLDLQGLLKSAALAYLSGTPLRIGFKGAREFADRLMTDLVDVGDYFGQDRHVVELNLSLARRAITLLGQQPEDIKAVEFPLPEPKNTVLDKVEMLLAAPKAPPVGGGMGAPNPLSSCKSPLTPHLPPNSNPDRSLNALSERAISQVANLPPALVRAPVEVPGSDQLLVGSQSESSACDNLPSVGSKNKRPLAVLIPGTTWDSKIWPAQSWSQLACQVSQSLGYEIVLTGGQKDVQTNHEIARECNSLSGIQCLDLTGKTSIIDLIALFGRADLVIGADTGPLHIAAATGKPKVVGVFGSTPWRRNGPYGFKCHAVALGLNCQPCFEKTCPLGTKACLIDMGPDYVLKNLTDFIHSKERTT